jgi:hypothetical protein
MAVTAFASGTKTADGTEQTLTDVNAAGVYQLNVDLNAMAAGDVLELRVKRITLTGGTLRKEYLYTFYGAQPAEAVSFDGDVLGNELTDATALRFTLTQTFGTNRNYPWKVLSYA